MNAPGQYRQFILGPKTYSAGRLLRISVQKRGPDDLVCWEVENLIGGEIIIVPAWDIGRELNAMEVLAWAAHSCG